MAYADLYADADLYLPLNNSATASINTGTYTSTTGNTSRTFTADAPANTGTSYSLHCTPNNSGSTLTPTFETYTLPHTNSSDKQTFTVAFWVKHQTTNGLNTLYLDDSLHSGHIIASTNTGGVGYGSLASLPSDNTGTISTGDWHHVAIVFKWKDTSETNNTLTQNLYIDGILDNDSWTGRDLQFTNIDNTYTSPKHLIAYSSGSTGMTAQVAHYAVWNNKALSPMEVYELAKYGMAKNNYSQIKQMTSLNPSMYFPLDTYTESNYIDNVGTSTFMSTATFSSGKFNNCFQATSTKYGYITGDSSEMLHPFNKSINFWIKMTASGATRYVLQKRDNTNVTQRWQVRIGADDNIGFWLRDVDFGYLYTSPDSANPLSLNEWTMVTLTMGTESSGGTGGGSAKIYYNGSLVYTEALDDQYQATINADSSIYFNRQSNNAGTYANTGTSYEGYQLDEISFYEYELDADDVKLLWDTRNQLKHWNGSAWVYPTDTQVHNGTTWIDGTWKHWDGFQWQPLNISN